jgi:hypothetical protein
LPLRNSLYSKELAIFSGGILPKALETQPGFPEVPLIGTPWLLKLGQRMDD